jgi:DNA-binding MarR family transcriptional regulator
MKRISHATTLNVHDRCLCLAAQRASRILAKHFDDALRDVGLTNGQFSLLMAVNQPAPPTIGSIADLLAMDRTTLTAALKPLERRGLVTIKVDREDRRLRRLSLTDVGHQHLALALPIWKREHAAIDAFIGSPKALHDKLAKLSKLTRSGSA